MLVDPEIMENSSILSIGTFNYLNVPINHDPLQFTDLSATHLKQYSLMYDSLVIYNPLTREIEPSLAKQWVVSNDSKYWLFTLRDDVLFHDGTKFNASAVKFTFDRLVNPDNPAYFPKDPKDIPLVSVSIKSEFEIIFRFFEPYAPFINDEAVIFFIPSPQSFNGSVLTNPIGTGPYSLDLGLSNGTFQYLTRFNDHFKGLPPFEYVHFHYFDSYPDLLDAIVNQEVNYIPAFYYNVDDYLPDSYWNLTTLNRSHTTGFGWYNHEPHSLTSDLNVRLAINHAINQQPMINLREGYATAAKSIIPVSSPFYKVDIPGYPYDMMKANTLLEEVGYSIGTSGYRFDLKILLIAGFEIDTDYLKSDLHAVGINPVFTIVPSLWEFGLAWATGEYNIAILGGSFVFNPQMEYDHFHTLGSRNLGNYSNSKVDELVVLSEQTPVVQEREYYLHRMQELIQQDAPYLPLITRDVFYARSTDIVPFVDSINERFTFTYFLPPSSALIDFSIENSSSIKEDNKIKYMHDVEISNLSIYFPFTDAVVTTKEKQALNIDMAMTHQLRSFLPGENEIGKFYQVSTNNSKISYYFRIYYDQNEIAEISVNKLGLFQYNFDSESWEELKIIASNHILHYVQVELQGGFKLLRLGELLAELTYRLLPIISIFSGVLIVIITTTLTQNLKTASEIKRRTGLK
jgi:peptide/nickel transport system substrate-binding protein